MTYLLCNEIVKMPQGGGKCDLDALSVTGDGPPCDGHDGVVVRLF